MGYYFVDVVTLDYHNGTEVVTIGTRAIDPRIGGELPFQHQIEEFLLNLRNTENEIKPVLGDIEEHFNEVISTLKDMGKSRSNFMEQWNEYNNRFMEILEELIAEEEHRNVTQSISVCIVPTNDSSPFVKSVVNESQFFTETEYVEATEDVEVAVVKAMTRRVNHFVEETTKEDARKTFDEMIYVGEEDFMPEIVEKSDIIGEASIDFDVDFDPGGVVMREVAVSTSVHYEASVETVDALPLSNMSNLGFKYINIGDYWAEISREVRGSLTHRKFIFPSGIKVLADHVRSKELKWEIYSEAGYFTCNKQMSDSLGNEEHGVNNFASWGIVDSAKTCVGNHVYCVIFVDMEATEIGENGEFLTDNQILKGWMFKVSETFHSILLDSNNAKSFAESVVLSSWFNELFGCLDLFFIAEVNQCVYKNFGSIIDVLLGNDPRQPIQNADLHFPFIPRDLLLLFCQRSSHNPEVFSCQYAAMTIGMLVVKKGDTIFIVPDLEKNWKQRDDTVASSFILLPAILDIRYGRYKTRIARELQAEYSKIGVIVEHALLSIRTVYSFTVENMMVASYSTPLERPVKLGLRQDLGKIGAVIHIGGSKSVDALLSVDGLEELNKHSLIWNSILGAHVLDFRHATVVGDLSLASHAILLSVTANSYQQTLAKTLSHHFKTMLLLVDMTKDFDIISVIDMFGLGETIVTWKIYGDPVIRYEFSFRMWLSISQPLSENDILLAFLQRFTPTTDYLRRKDELELSQVAATYLNNMEFLLIVDDDNDESKFLYGVENKKDEIGADKSEFEIHIGVEFFKSKVNVGAMNHTHLGGSWVHYTCLSWLPPHLSKELNFDLTRAAWVSIFVTSIVAQLAVNLILKWADRTVVRENVSVNALCAAFLGSIVNEREIQLGILLLRSKLSPQSTYLSREDTTHSRGRYCYENGYGNEGGYRASIVAGI